MPVTPGRSKRTAAEARMPGLRVGVRGVTLTETPVLDEGLGKESIDVKVDVRVEK